MNENQPEIDTEIQVIDFIHDKMIEFNKSKTAGLLNFLSHIMHI